MNHSRHAFMVKTLLGYAAGLWISESERIRLRLASVQDRFGEERDESFCNVLDKTCRSARFGNMISYSLLTK